MTAATRSLPFWTWLLPLPICYFGTFLSLHFQIAPGSSIWYLPIPLGLVLVHWWGPRVLPAIWLNAYLNAGAWGLQHTGHFPLYALPETLAVGASWLLAGRGRTLPWMPDPRSLLAFAILGLLLPVTLGGLLTQGQLVLLGELAQAEALPVFQLGWIADLLGCLTVTVPLLCVLSGPMERRGWSRTRGAAAAPTLLPSSLPPVQVLELALLLIGSLVLALKVPLHGHWHVFGLAGLWAALRLRMAGALLLNLWLVTLALLMPALAHLLGHDSGDQAWPLRLTPQQLPEAQLSLLLILVAVLATARALQSADERLAERQLAEGRLRDEREELETTLASIGDAVIATDANGAIARMNPVAERLTGWSAAEALGLHLDTVFVIRNARTRQPVPSPVARVLGSGAVVGLANHTILLARDGREVHIADSGAPIRDSSGVVRGVVLVFRDVGDEERVREQAAQHQKLEALGQLAGGVAHDFNNLLTAITAAAEMLQRRSGGDDRHTGMILTAAGRGADLARQLLAFARKTPLREEAVDINRCVQETASLLERLIERRISVSTLIESSAPLVQGDPSQLQNAILNLAINARDAISGAGTITLAVETLRLGEDEAASRSLPVGDYVQIRVSDTGCGIAPEILPCIFDPFFTTKGPGQGTGLGLASVYGIVRAHHGAITVDSHPGTGTTFLLLLPRSSSLPDALSHGAVELRPCRVLVVDDDHAVRGALGALLLLDGCTVEEAVDGSAALARLEREPLPDLVILDLDMPVLGGVETCVRLRQHQRGIAVLLVSGHGARGPLDQLLALPRTGFLPKPFTRSELATAIRRVAPELTG